MMNQTVRAILGIGLVIVAYLAGYSSWVGIVLGLTGIGFLISALLSSRKVRS